MQKKEIVLVGSYKPIKIDCRIIVATNQNLQDACKTGTFKQRRNQRRKHLFGYQCALFDKNTYKEMSLREYNFKIVKKYLKKYYNNTKLVAEKLDVGVATIYRMLKEDI